MDLDEIKQGLSTGKLETYRQVLDCKTDSELIAVYMAMQNIMSESPLFTCSIENKNISLDISAGLHKSNICHQESN